MATGYVTSLLDRQLLEQLAQASARVEPTFSAYRDNALSVEKDPSRDGYIINDGRTRVFVDRITGKHTTIETAFNPDQSVIAVGEALSSNQAWLDRRVNELRVRL